MDKINSANIAKNNSVNIIIGISIFFLSIYFITQNFELLSPNNFFKTESCENLENNFEKYSNLNLNQFCINDSYQEVIWVGARLIHIENRYVEGFKRYEYNLEFINKNISRNISINSNSSNIPYEIGYFYQFNIKKMCVLSNSMASSGSYYDPYFIELNIRPDCSNKIQ